MRACVLRRTRRLIPPLIYVLIYVLPCVTRRGTYRYARRLYASPILSRAPNVNADKPRQCTVPSLSLPLESVVILIKNRLEHVRKASHCCQIDINTISCQSEQVVRCEFILSIIPFYESLSLYRLFYRSNLGKRIRETIQVYARSYNYFND